MIECRSTKCGIMKSILDILEPADDFVQEVLGTPIAKNSARDLTSLYSVRVLFRMSAKFSETSAMPTAVCSRAAEDDIRISPPRSALAIVRPSAHGLHPEHWTFPQPFGRRSGDAGMEFKTVFVGRNDLNPSQFERLKVHEMHWRVSGDWPHDKFKSTWIGEIHAATARCG